jgi:hypothetical protein
MGLFDTYDSGYWLEFLGFVDSVGGSCIDRKSGRNVNLQVSALDKAKIDWTRKQNYQWLQRNWKALSAHRLPRAKILLRILQHGPDSPEPDDSQFRDALDYDAEQRRERFARNHQPQQKPKQTPANHLILKETAR